VPECAAHPSAGVCRVCVRARCVSAQTSLVQHLLAVGSTNPATPKDAEFAGFFGPATEFMLVGPATFVNYGGGVLRSCLECGEEEVRAASGGCICCVHA
jgi:hypothetical protein